MNKPLQEKLNEAAKLLEPILWATLEDDSDVYTLGDEPCSKCDEQHKHANCGRSGVTI